MQPQVLIITGMHRSGTSLAAALMEAAGVNIGSTKLRPGPHNRKGYFEDRDFFRLESRILNACSGESAPRYRSIGWTAKGPVDTARAFEFADEARALVDEKNKCGNPLWGWKDPRTVLLLDLWDRVIPSAGYLFVYRPYWEVFKSFLESEIEIFRDHARWPIDIWSHYNRRIMEFIEKRRDRCALVSCDALLKAPFDVLRTAGKRLGIQLSQDIDAASIIDPSMMKRSDGKSPLARLLSPYLAEENETLKRLEGLADMPGGYAIGDARDNRDEVFDAILKLQSENAAEYVPFKVKVFRYQEYLSDLRGSRIWRLRALWFRLRRALGLKTEIGDIE